MSRGGTTTARLGPPRRGPSRRWMILGSCIDAPELPWLADHAAPDVTAQLRAVCESCPVRHHCADYVERACINGGFWAGQHRWDSRARPDRAA